MGIESVRDVGSALQPDVLLADENPSLWGLKVICAQWWRPWALFLADENPSLWGLKGASTSADYVKFRLWLADENPSLWGLKAQIRESLIYITRE